MICFQTFIQTSFNLKLYHLANNNRSAPPRIKGETLPSLEALFVCLNFKQITHGVNCKFIHQFTQVGACASSRQISLRVFYVPAALRQQVCNDDSRQFIEDGFRVRMCRSVRPVRDRSWSNVAHTQQEKDIKAPVPDVEWGCVCVWRKENNIDGTRRSRTCCIPSGVIRDGASDHFVITTSVCQWWRWGIVYGRKAKKCLHLRMCCRLQMM